MISRFFWCTQNDRHTKKYINIIKSSSENLLKILNDILDFSKIEAGKIELENRNFNLIHSLNIVYETFRNPAVEKKLQLKLIIDPKTPEYVIGDSGRLMQVLINLTGNAIKFTEEGSVTIRTVASINKNESSVVYIIFSVSDTGIGIHREKQNLIFESFSQASSDTTRKYGGTGLGLSISKRLVELMGGKISVKSKSDKGAVFSFTIPFPIGAANNT